MPCSDGNACTSPDTCQSGTCTAGAAVTCTAPSCSGSTLTSYACNPASGCVMTVAACPNHFKCSSGSACASSCTDRSTDFCAVNYKCASNQCVAATVSCGGTSCAVADGNTTEVEGCCISGTGQTAAGTTFTCQTSPTGTCGGGQYLVGCNSRADCPSNSVCCWGQSNSAPSACAYFGAVCYTGATCPPSTTGGHYNQMCDPNLSSTECTSGTCKAFTQCPALGLYSCQ
jgi:hypothetical protein